MLIKRSIKFQIQHRKTTKTLTKCNVIQNIKILEMHFLNQLVV